MQLIYPAHEGEICFVDEFGLVVEPPPTGLKQPDIIKYRLKQPLQPSRQYCSRFFGNIHNPGRKKSDVGNYVKLLYGHRCQISGTRLGTPPAPYAEASHIRPVGKPHNGPDTVDNILCPSPNMQALFDLDAISLTYDFKILGLDEDLEIKLSSKYPLRWLKSALTDFLTVLNHKGQTKHPPTT